MNPYVSVRVAVIWNMFHERFKWLPVGVFCHGFYWYISDPIVSHSMLQDTAKRISLAGSVALAQDPDSDKVTHPYQSECHVRIHD